jgi:hypothetical protein
MEVAEYCSKALFDEYGLILCQQQRQNNMCKPSIGELGVKSDLDMKKEHRIYYQLNLLLVF